MLTFCWALIVGAEGNGSPINNINRDINGNSGKAIDYNTKKFLLTVITCRILGLTKVTEYQNITIIFPQKAHLSILALRHGVERSRNNDLGSSKHFFDQSRF